jgi:hypothetical protein
MMNFRNTILYISIASILVFSCKKEEVVSELQFQKNLLAGTGSYQNSQRIWRLDSILVDDKPIILTTLQKLYKKTFVFDGVYKDTEMNEGQWELPELNKLKQKIYYKLTNKIDSTSYEIISINAARLKLRVTGSKSKTDYSFIISN